MIKYSVIVPLFNEEEVIQVSFNRIKKVMDDLKEDYEIIFVNDGSSDKTKILATEIADNNREVKLISFSRNFGHQPAISAGMDYAKGEAVIVIDADLQDPPEVIPKMIEKWKEGFQVVYGKRLKRKGETFFKKATAKMFYRILRKFTNVDIPVDTGDFRLIDRAVLNVFKTLNEKNRFIRGLISWIGFKQTYVEYVRDERFAGETKYPLKKMIKFASDGIISFSYIPLKFATYTGFLVSIVSFMYLIYVIISKVFFPSVYFVPGWTSLIALMLILNGIVLIILGMMGEYIGRIYDEVRNRPLYIVEDEVNFDKE